VKKETPIRYTLNEAAAKLGERGYQAREDKWGKEVIRKTALENLEKAREKRWAD
jgi:predicted acetyltransferase